MQANAATETSQHRSNKSLQPTAYSLRSFARASLRRFGFRRRVSLIVVPRGMGSTLGLSPFVVNHLWSGWRRVGVRLRSAEWREDFLGTFAPLALLIVLALWVMGLIVGYGLVLHAMSAQIKPSPQHLGDAFYLAGVSLLTIGFGDMVPKGARKVKTSVWL